MAKTGITPTREEDYPEWYQQVIKAADLAENSTVRGCMVIKPWGYGIWENMQKALDQMFKDTGHENAYFPLFIPKSFLEKEAEHVEGFAKECAIVTHSRLEPGPDGGLVPTGPLEEPLIVRPTSETIIGDTFSRWVQSYRDLPLLINQWCNVVRWEMRTRLFLRTAEFLWQEGHTVHATAEEALEETARMLDVYADFAENFMAMPVIKGEKTKGERFPGAEKTLTIEAMMQDRKALQSGTSHFLGQNFSRAQEIKFQSKEGREEFAWTTSWGLSTRMVGALIMSHGDDDGLVLPPKLAPIHVVIVPIYRKDEERDAVMTAADKLALELRADGLRVEVDRREGMKPGAKYYEWERKGVPIRLELGPRDLDSQSVMSKMRLAELDERGRPVKDNLPMQDLGVEIGKRLDAFQTQLFDRALARREGNTVLVDSWDDFVSCFEDGKSSFVYAHWDGTKETELAIKEVTKATLRCIPLKGEGPDPKPGVCVKTGKPSAQRVLFAKNY